jgi:hypothetical protein
MTPTNKVVAGVLAGAITTIGAWAARQFGGVELPAEVQGAITVAVTFVVQYLVPDKPTASE